MRIREPRQIFRVRVFERDSLFRRFGPSLMSYQRCEGLQMNVSLMRFDRYNFHMIWTRIRGVTIDVRLWCDF